MWKMSSSCQHCRCCTFLSLGGTIVFLVRATGIPLTSRTRTTIGVAEYPLLIRFLQRHIVGVERLCAFHGSSNGPSNFVVGKIWRLLPSRLLLSFLVLRLLDLGSVCRFDLLDPHCLRGDIR